MSTTLNGINLEGLIIDDDYDLKIDTIFQKSCNGSPILYSKERTFKNINLIGGSDWGWVSKYNLNLLKSIASVQNATYELNYENNIYKVRFRTEEPPVISANPLIKRPNIQNTDYNNNILIKLMEVE